MKKLEKLVDSYPDLIICNCHICDRLLQRSDQPGPLPPVAARCNNKPVCHSCLNSFYSGNNEIVSKRQHNRIDSSEYLDNLSFSKTSLNDIMRSVVNSVAQ